MIAFSRSVPNAGASTTGWPRPRWAAFGIHAAVLDLDIGPLLQVQKLLELGPICARQGLYGATDCRRA